MKDLIKGDVKDLIKGDETRRFDLKDDAIKAALELTQRARDIDKSSSLLAIKIKNGYFKWVGMCGIIGVGRYFCIKCLRTHYIINPGTKTEDHLKYALMLPLYLQEPLLNTSTKRGISISQLLTEYIKKGLLSEQLRVEEIDENSR